MGGGAGGSMRPASLPATLLGQTSRSADAAALPWEQTRVGTRWRGLLSPQRDSRRKQGAERGTECRTASQQNAVYVCALTLYAAYPPDVTRQPIMGLLLSGSKMRTALLQQAATNAWRSSLLVSAFYGWLWDK